MNKSWYIPKADAAYVARMEDVLEVYSWSYDSRYPTVCFDETNKQLVKNVIPALPMAPATGDKPGQIERYDHHYERNGTANIFVFFEPQRGWRHLKATEQRTKQDFAHCMRELVDQHYSEAECITVVMDNLNTHHESSLYETFEPAMRHLSLLRPGASSTSWISTTHPSTAVGST